MWILHQDRDKFMQLVRIAGHEFAAVPDFLGRLIAGTVGHRIEPDDGPAFGVTEGVVEGV
jgi:hypothetical protein